MALRYSGGLLGAQYANRTVATVGKRSSGKQSDVCQVLARWDAGGLREREQYLCGECVRRENHPADTRRKQYDCEWNFDWVYEEEFFCRDGFRWSPDGKYIAYWQSDTEGTGWFDIINNVDSLYPKIIRFPYPKAGTTNSAVKVGYVAATGGETTWIDLPGDPRQNYIMRMEFIPESNDLFIQQMNRPQNTNKVWIASIGGGAPKIS